jgi:hypothetical protein
MNPTEHLCQKNRVTGGGQAENERTYSRAGEGEPRSKRNEAEHSIFKAKE